jgi:tRNA U34 5-methylaminomethyl-2-thiouridine-forming methyltransferase MnmC
MERVTDFFHLKKEEVSVQDAVLEQKYDIIFYDAFGPRAQPDMWTPEIFEKLYKCLVPGGMLVTYCAKGQVRRDMQSVGFRMERLPGPPGKREMMCGFQ